MAYLIDTTILARLALALAARCWNCTGAVKCCTLRRRS